MRYHVAGRAGGVWEVVRTDHNGIETTLNTRYASKYAAGERAHSLNMMAQRREKQCQEPRA